MLFGFGQPETSLSDQNNYRRVFVLRSCDFCKQRFAGDCENQLYILILLLAWHLTLKLLSVFTQSLYT